jgi:hypothetical protein
MYMNQYFRYLERNKYFIILVLSYERNQTVTVILFIV